MHAHSLKFPLLPQILLGNWRGIWGSYSWKHFLKDAGLLEIRPLAICSMVFVLSIFTAGRINNQVLKKLVIVLLPKEKKKKGKNCFGYQGNFHIERSIWLLGFVCVVPSEKFCSQCLTHDSAEASLYSSCNIQWAEASGKDALCNILLLSRQCIYRVTWPAFKMPVSFPRIKAWSSHSLGEVYEVTELAFDLESPSSCCKLLVHLILSVQNSCKCISPIS